MSATLHTPEFSPFPFPEHTNHGYYALDRGEYYVPRELHVFDVLGMMSKYVEIGLPRPDVIVSNAKGGMQDGQYVSYLLGVRNGEGKACPRVFTTQTIKYDMENKPLEEIIVANVPRQEDLAGSKVILVTDEMVDGESTPHKVSIDEVTDRIRRVAPKSAKVISAVSVAKVHRYDSQGYPQASGSVDIIGRLIGPEWIQLANQHETFEGMVNDLREVKAKNPNYDREVSRYSPDLVIPEYFPHLLTSSF